MAVLNDGNLLDALETGALVIRPLAQDALQPSSLDLRLGAELLIATPDGFRSHHLVNDGPLRLRQHAFVLGCTLEWIEIAPHLVGVLAGKSSRAREGIQVESAGLIDAGWKGRLTLEIVMLSPIPTHLTWAMGIGQLYIHTLETTAVRPYGTYGIGRYQNSDGPVESLVVPGKLL